MCGISGIYNYRSHEPADEALLLRMTRVITHRGPDDEGIQLLGPCGLGSRRLSILDISGGHMPMASADKKTWITFNGEVYNFMDLRKPLEARGHDFHTHGDTEVILHDFMERGPEACRSWNGMFAAAIYDTEKNRLFVARDHFGIKPVYYYDSGQTLLFGSELKSILEDPRVSRELDHEALQAFLTLRYLPSPLTLLKNIRKLPPGHYLLADESGVHVTRYFDEVPTLDERITEAEIIDQYLDLFGKAVKRQMVADVPVGLMLSGGVDSAALAYYMARASDRKIQTFSIGFPGTGDWNELNDAGETAELIGTDHHPLLIEKDDYTEFFPKSFWYLEEPTSEPTISAYYHVCKLAAGHLKVVLMGQGADEPLAGYDRYFGERYHGLVAPFLRWTPLGKVIELLPRSEKMKMSVRSLAEKDSLERFLKIQTVFQPQWQKDLVKPGVLAPDRDIWREVRSILKPLQQRVSHLPPLSQLLYLDARTMLSDNLLLFGDKISMANSLEVRVPYLDVELIRFVESIPPHFKIRGLERKYFHRKAMSRVLPEKIINRKKRGFATPMDSWFRTELTGVVRKVLMNPDAAVADVFKQDVIKHMIDLHVSGRENFRKQIFVLLSYEFWAQRFLHGRTVSFADYK
ncbi:MAG: asparagine synthase (glutamine-hydrolyzing) [Calditrichaeota bacterium]|nr:asparagine synthase (glutamine-hydrolyzing) [Calditrichota bacterium]MCB9365567.1 asparagine synthase (glutamine-hydrolyzing) [Calditrichota bacterium]